MHSDTPDFRLERNAKLFPYLLLYLSRKGYDLTGCRIPIVHEGKRMPGRYADMAPAIASYKSSCLNQACSRYFYVSRSLGPGPVRTSAHVVNCFFNEFKKIMRNYSVFKERTCAVDSFVSVKYQQAFCVSYVEHGIPHLRKGSVCC